MDRPGGHVTRSRLLDAAVDLIAERGWGRVTTRAVAERAGLPHGTVSYHFAGKQALLAEAALDMVERSFPLEQVRRADGLAGLLSLLYAWATAEPFAGGAAPDNGDAPASADPTGGPVLMEAMREAARDAAVRDRLAGLLADYRQAVADLVRADQRRGRFPARADPLGIATLLAAVGDGLLLHALLDPAVDLARAVDTLGALLPTHPARCEPRSTPEGSR